MTIHFQDHCGAALLHYRNQAQFSDMLRFILKFVNQYSLPQNPQVTGQLVVMNGVSKAAVQKPNVL